MRRKSSPKANQHSSERERQKRDEERERQKRNDGERSKQMADLRSKLTTQSGSPAADEALSLLDAVEEVDRRRNKRQKRHDIILLLWFAGFVGSGSI